jgi:ribonuclease HI
MRSDKSRVNEYQIVFDGGSKGNPGPGYGSFVIVQSEEPVVHERIELGDWITNNEAEYLTLIRALERLLTLVNDGKSDTSVTILGDSELVVNQVNGLWKIKKPELRVLRDRAVDLLRQFGHSDVKWHSRINSVFVLGH